MGMTDISRPHDSCDRCHRKTADLESYDVSKIFICRQCGQTWDVIYSRQLAKHITCKVFWRIWDEIFYAFLANKMPLPTWDELILKYDMNGESKPFTFILS